MNLYYSPVSPFCRSVMLTAKAIGLSLNKMNMKYVNTFKGEHLKPEFRIINPQHTIPTLVDDDLTLWESRAICTYLVSRYGTDDSLYPKDPKKRVLVDKFLYFDMGTLSERNFDYFFPVVTGKSEPDPKKLERLEEALVWLNGFLDGHDFCVGNNITVADFVLIATVSSIIEAKFLDISKFSNIQAWANRCKTQMLGYETENGDGAKKFGEVVQSKFTAWK